MKEAFKQLPMGWVRSLVPRLESAWPPRVLAQGFSLFATLKNHWGACQKADPDSASGQRFWVSNQLPGDGDCWSRYYTLSGESLKVMFVNMKLGWGVVPRAWSNQDNNLFFCLLDQQWSQKMEGIQSSWLWLLRLSFKKQCSSTFRSHLVHRGHQTMCDTKIL